MGSMLGLSLIFSILIAMGVIFKFIMNTKKLKIIMALGIIAIISIILLVPFTQPDEQTEQTNQIQEQTGQTTQDPNISQTYPPQPQANLSLENIPDYSGKAYVEINNNQAQLSPDWEILYETYEPLDNLSRPVHAHATVTSKYMPTKKRESISHIKPAGWHTYKYENLIEDKYLYNRCHLIGFQLTGENDNENNLITGTRFMNLNMVPFENEIAAYMKSNPDSPVAIDVTPVYSGNNLLCNGLHYQALSKDYVININIYLYNVQPGIYIDYATGESHAI